MKKINFFVFCAFISALAFSFSLSLNAAEKREVARFEKLSGGVDYDSLGETGYRELGRDEAMGVKLCVKDKISSRSGSAGEIVTNYGASLDFAEGTEIQMLDFSVRINRGGVWINYKPVKDSGGTKKFTVVTPAGTIGIKGTVFKVDVKGGITTVVVAKGEVTFTSNSGEKVDIKAGEKLVIVEGKPVPKPVKASLEELINAYSEDGEKDGKKDEKNGGGDKNKGNEGESGRTGSSEAPAGEGAGRTDVPQDGGKVKTDVLGPNEGASPFKKND